MSGTGSATASGAAAVAVSGVADVVDAFASVDGTINICKLIYKYFIIFTCKYYL